MSREQHPRHRLPDHDEMIEELLEDLANPEEREAVDRLSDLDASERTTVRRVDLELFGLMPYTLEPEEPGADLKARVLEAARRPEANRMEGSPSEPMAFPATPEPRSGSGRGWMLPLAATLALVSLLVAGLLFGRLREQQRVSAELASALDAERHARAELSESLRRAADARSQLELVTQPGVEMCPLRPGSAAQGRPFGALYVAPDHQHWYLALYGLPPVPEGSAYQVWFVADGAPISAGTFTAQPGSRVELASETMPANTTGVLVTIEAADGAESPTGPEVLFGDEVMRLL